MDTTTNTQAIIAATVSAIGVVNIVIAGALQKGTWPRSVELSRPWRMAIVATLGTVAAVASGALDGGVSSWASFGRAFGLGLLAAAPGVIREWLQTIVAPTVALALVATLGASTSACAGSFEEAKLAGMKVRATPPSSRCVSLDNAHRTWGGIAKGAAFAAGASGIGSIPLGDETSRVAVAASGAAIGTVAAVSVFVSEDYAAAWARECGQ